MSQDSVNQSKDNKIKNFFRTIGYFIKAHKIATIVIIFMVIIGMISVNFIQRVNSMRTAKEAMNDMPITTPLTKMDLTSSISVTGSIASADSRSISTTLNGTQIQEVKVSVGDYVTAGDVIVVFDSEDLEENLLEAESNATINNLKNEKSLDDAVENVTEASENYTKQAAGLQQEVNSAWSNYNDLSTKRDNAKVAYESAQEAREKAQQDYNNSLSSNGMYSQAATTALEQAKLTEEQAYAQYLDYENQVSVAYGNYYGRLNDQTETNEKNADQIEDADYNYRITVLEQQNSRRSQNNQIQEAEEKLGKTVITSPISGVITSVNVEAGDSYDGGVLFVVEDMEHFVVTASVDEYDIADIQKDLKAVVKTDATDDEELTGVVSFVSPTPASSSSSMGSSMTSSSSGYEIEIVLNDYHERLRIGMTAKTSIILASAEDVYAVAYDCVRTDEKGKTYVEVIENTPTSTEKGDSKTSRIYVEIGMESDYYTEIISDELKEGMSIVATESSGDSTQSMFGDMPQNGMPDGGEMPGGNRGGNMGGGPGGGMPGGF